MRYFSCVESVSRWRCDKRESGRLKSAGLGVSPLDLIDEIYRVGVEHHDWDSVLGRVAEYMGAPSGTLGISDVSVGASEPTLHIHGLDEAFVYGTWLGEFGLEDVWADQGYAPAEGEILTGAQLLPLDQLRKKTVHSAVHQPLGIEDCLVTSLRTMGSRVMYISLYQNRAHGPFGPDDRERFGLITPHLVRAAHLDTLLTDAHLDRRVSQAALEQIDQAVFVVRNVRAEALNSRAEALANTGEGLTLRDRCLRASDLGSEDMLQAALIAAGGGQTIPRPATATPLPLRRGVDRLPLTCWVVPVANEAETGLAAIAGQGCALVFVGDPEDRPELPSDAIVRIFGLTPAEAKVATAVASGQTLREYADERGVTENTVRWQFKRVQEKLGTSRQLEVASVLWKAVPGSRR